MIIILILVFDHIITISSESISNSIWTNIIHDLASNINGYKSNDKTMESHPFNEGFMLQPNNRKQSSSTISSSTSLIVINRISTLHNILSTTCKTTTLVENLNHTISPIDNHRGQGISNETNNDNGFETSLKQTLIEDDNNEIDSFLKVDDEELSKQLVNIAYTTDGSGDTTTQGTTEQTSETTITSSEPSTNQPDTNPTTISTTALIITTTTTTPVESLNPSNNTIIIMTINCTNANNTLFDILNKLNQTLNNNYSVSPNYNEIACNGSTSVDVTLHFETLDNIAMTNGLYEVLENITSPLGVQLFTFNKCGRNETESVINVTSCFLINLCHLCGIDPPRGVCLPQNGVSKCKCFVNDNDSSILYVGDRCLPADINPIKSSFPSRWTPVIVGIVAGVASLFGAITFCLWAMAIWRRRRPHNKDDLRTFRFWHLPRAQVPSSVTQGNVQNNRTNTISTYSSDRTESDDNQSNTTDSTFFKELDQKMGENLRATITRPNTSAILASLPSDTISTISNNDPIDELDAIIDNEDLNLTFHDSLDDLYEDNEIVEAVNPNFKLPRSNIESNPTGFFSKFVIEQLTQSMEY
ncbi:unnamed protein product [Rotaria sp. Silwood2]|nr:unnamed protein product [Rotaria sp. Silwood2]